MQLNGKRQYAGHLKGDKHNRNLRRNTRLGLASLNVVQPAQLRSASPPQAPPAADAGAAPPYEPPTAEAGAGHARRSDDACSHLKNVDIRKFNKGATKRKDSNNQHYANHADRYQRDAGYRADCENHVPPTPEHLYWEDGSYAYKW